MNALSLGVTLPQFLSSERFKVRICVCSIEKYRGIHTYATLSYKSLDKMLSFAAL